MHASSQKVRQLCTIALAFAAVLGEFGSARADVFTSDGLFSASGQSIWSGGAGYTLSKQDFLGTSWNKGDTVGSVDSECFLGACAYFGAQIGANTNGRLGLDYSLAANSGTFGLLYPGQASISTPNVVSGTPGNPGLVTIGTGFSGLPSVRTSTSAPASIATLQVAGPTVQASLGLAASAEAFAGAQVCVVACVGPSFGPPPLNASRPLVSINQGNSSLLTVLGQTVSANQNFSSPDGLLNASVRLPNLDSSSTVTPGGFNGGALTAIKRDGVAAVYANLAQVAADAAGFPIPLSGNLGPFGYNLLQTNAGTALSVEQTLSFTPSATGTLRFSSTVTPFVNGALQAPANAIGFNAGDFVAFLPGQVSSLSIQPEFDLKGILHNTTDLVVDGNINVRALGLDIAGVSLGPLVDQGLADVDLGHISLLDTSFQDDIGTILGNPVDLSFSCGGALTGGEFPTIRACSSSKYVDKGPIFVGTDGTRYDEIDLITCPSYTYTGGSGPGDPGANCSSTFANLSTPYVLGPSGRVELAGDPLDFRLINPGGSVTDSSENALLRSLGYTPGAPSFAIPQGAPLDSFAVPEPSSAAALGFALAGLLGTRQHRRVAYE